MDAPKSPPPDLTLRRDPPPVTRFSRRVLAVLLGLGSFAVLASLIYGLGRHSAQRTPPPELHSTAAPVSERLNALPSSYADIPRPRPEPPKLGEPLPGDLGRPILSAQRRMTAGEDEAARAARLTLAREQEQARTAKVFFATVGQRNGGPAPAVPPVAISTETGDAALPPLDEEAAQNQQDHKLAFLRRQPDTAVASPQRLRPPASPYLVSAGAVIRAALLTAVNSDLPGLAQAQVTENVCDSVTGRHLLIPQGARLIGEVDSQVSYGQERLLAAWTQIKFPDGSTLMLDRLAGADPSGAAGFDADVDYHTWRLAKGVILSSLLGIGSELAANTGTRDGDRIVIATRDSANQAVNQVGQRITAKELAVQPTLTRAAGYPFAVLVAKDLVLRPLGRC